MDIKFGWKASPEQFGPEELLRAAVAADEAGYDSLDISDHFAPWSLDGQASFSWTVLGAMSALTSTIEMGTGVTCPILRYHPAIIAQASATLNKLAPGRTYLSVGTGESLNEYPVTTEWPGYEERQEMLAEAILLIRDLWTGDEVTSPGPYFPVDKARLWTPPEDTIPLYISSLTPDSARFAGRYGDGLITVGGKQPEVYQQMQKEFEVGARDAEKDPTNMPRLIELFVAYSDNEDQILDTMLKYWAGSFVPALYNQKVYTPKLSQENGKVVGKDTVRKMCCISGDPQRHIENAQQYIDLGFTHLYFHSADPDQQDFINRYARDVLPALRQRQGQAQPEHTNAHSA